MVTSWKLWSALRNPPALHPLFQRNAGLQYQVRLPMLRSSGEWTEMILIGVLVVLLVTNPHLALVFILIVPLTIIGALLALPLLLPLLINVTGALWSAVVGAEIADAREKGTYDLLCLTPDGQLGANWAICSGCLHRSDVFEVLYLVVRALSLFGIVLIGISLIITGGILINAQFNFASVRVVESLRTLLDILALVIGYHIHYVQSVALSSLVGLLTPFYFNRPVEVKLIAPVSFLALQAITYAVTFALAFRILPTLYTDAPTWFYMIQPLVALLIFAVIREAVVLAVWHRVQMRLSTHSSEMTIMAALI